MEYLSRGTVAPSGTIRNESVVSRHFINFLLFSEIGRRLLSRSRTRSLERDRRSRSRSRSRSRKRSRRSRSRNRSRSRGRRSRSRNRSRCRGRRSRSRSRSRSKDRCFREDEFRVRKRKEKKKYVPFFQILIYLHETPLDFIYIVRCYLHQDLFYSPGPN